MGNWLYYLSKLYKEIKTKQGTRGPGKSGQNFPSLQRIYSGDNYSYECKEGLFIHNNL
jgi:hypothetical protein